VANSASRVEQAARVARKQGPAKLRTGYQQTEQVLNRTRAIGSTVADQATRAFERTREVGADIADGAQSLSERIQKRVR
jgi:hypothetical protein